MPANASTSSATTLSGSPRIGSPNAVFGGAAANPLFFSAQLPILFSMVGYRSPSLRGILAGLAVGFAAVLLARAFSGSAAVALLPPGLASWPRSRFGPAQPRAERKESIAELVKRTA